MKSQEIRDTQGRLLGRINEETSYRSVARNASGRLLGSHNPNTNQTRDANGRLLLSKGNGLSGLITGKR
jgi:YD repeat-containing protein